MPTSPHNARYIWADVGIGPYEYKFEFCFGGFVFEQKDSLFDMAVRVYFMRRTGYDYRKKHFGQSNPDYDFPCFFYTRHFAAI